MHNPAYVRSLLVLNGIHQRKIAKDLGITEPAVSRTVSGKIQSKRTKKAIAQLLKMPYQELWKQPEPKDAA